jgi:hypothetical protein
VPSAVSLTPEDRLHPSDFYARRTAELRVESTAALTRHSLYAQILIVLALLVCLALYESIVAKNLPLWSALPVVAVGAFVVQRRHRCQLEFLKVGSLLEYYEKGTARLNRKWDLLDPGDAFIDPDHFYSRDLDLFGQGSLYQLLCSARTAIGRQTLARWMLVPASLEEIRARQAAIAELQARRDFPEQIAAASPAKAAPDFRPEALRAWAAESAPPFPFWAPVLAFLLALTAIALPLLYFAGVFPLPILWTSLIRLFAAQAVFAVAFRSRVKAVLDSLGTLSFELPIMAELLEIMERERFSSAKLTALVASLQGDAHASASATIRSLLRLTRLVKERENEWFLYPSLCLLWATQFAMAIARWRRRHGRQVLEWIAILGELEALISLSTYSFEHPQDPFPELAEDGPVFEAEELGHPLLDERTCVRNTIAFGDSARFFIVSGSNMSGKSTFLRAVGVNAVLALMGAPVCCKKLKISHLTIGAAVRIQDSVVDGRSHFMAEMQRLRRMIESANKNKLLFLVDEIMGGTNSHDRRIATEWVIGALMLRGAIGSITTHDLALTEIAADGLPGRNVHFEDSGEGGTLLFDYKLREGILRHSNALAIAHLLGIDTAAGSGSV